MGRRSTWVLILSLALPAMATAAPDLAAFARCLNRAGATYYYASWCPHCAVQDRLFGSAVTFLRRVDCTRGCRGVASLPTWHFADGSQHAGVASFEVLAARTHCRLGPPREDHDSGAGEFLNDEFGEFIFLGHENFSRQPGA